MAKTIQVRSVTLSASNGHADIIDVLSNPKKYGLPDGANHKVLVLTILDRYADEAIIKYGSGGSSSGDKVTHTHDAEDDGSDDAMNLLGP